MVTGRTEWAPPLTVAEYKATVTAMHDFMGLKSSKRVVERHPQDKALFRLVAYWK